MPTERINPSDGFPTTTVTPAHLELDEAEVGVPTEPIYVDQPEAQAGQSWDHNGFTIFAYVPEPGEAPTGDGEAEAAPADGLLFRAVESPESQRSHARQFMYQDDEFPTLEAARAAVDDAQSAHERVVGLGARRTKPSATDAEMEAAGWVRRVLTPQEIVGG